MNGNGAQDVEEPTVLPRKKARDRPLLTPWGRKLRHLNGIALRNIRENVPLRPRGRTNDDTSIAEIWRSTSHILPVYEENTLSHSKSSSDLALMAASQSQSPELRSPRGRRRSTRVEADDPIARQKMFEEAASTKLPDTFFSLHHASLEEPIYISEVVRSSANPNFRPFDLMDCGPEVTWLNSVIVRVWLNATDGARFKLLLKLDVSLHALQFMGTLIENFRQPLPANCVVFSLTDGVYSILTDVAIDTLSHIPSPYQAKNHEVLKETSSYDALMKLKTLEECIWDAELTREKISRNIEGILERKQDSIDIIRKVSQKKDDLRVAQGYEATTRRELRNMIERRDKLKASIMARKAAVERGAELRRSTEKYLVEARVKLAECKDLVKATKEGIKGQQRRIITEVQDIYPIEPIPGKALAFTIRDLYLPNSEFEDVNEDAVAAALGYTAHLVHMLSLYLGVPLLYSVEVMGSNSFMKDLISVIQGSRVFPLWPKGQVSYRFEYAVFLLNKDIEMLLSSQSIVVMDIRNTLPNLKYLLYAITSSGKTPIPEREWPTAPFRLLKCKAQKEQQRNKDKLTAGIMGKQPVTVSTSPVSTNGDFSYPRMEREASRLSLRS